jgi:hypothetical protein
MDPELGAFVVRELLRHPWPSDTATNPKSPTKEQT